MKSVPKLTEYFQDQAPDLTTDYNNQIKQFSASLFNLYACPLCKNDYQLSKEEKKPRILIHCGHTFCSECLKQFLTNNRIRCPMCLKLIKKIKSIEQLPINHTIYAQLRKQIGQQENPYKFLCTEFTMSTGKRLRRENPPQTDEESGLKYCCFHSERVQHFFCLYHETPGCRQCMETTHKRKECKILDLFDTEAKKMLAGQYQ